jgi:host factor-I protein
VAREKKRVERGGAMKDATDSIPAVRPIEQEAFANRKLIRPSLNRDHDHSQPSMHGQPPMGERRERPGRPERIDRGDRGDRGDRSGGRRSAPPEQTNAENFYYQKQMQAKTPMVVVLRDGEEIHGTIEWYDKACIKVNRPSGPNLMIYKPSIKYMFKEGENGK